MGNEFIQSGSNNVVEIGNNVTVTGGINGNNNKLVIGDSINAATLKININGDYNNIYIGNCYAVKNLYISCGNHVKAHNTSLNIEDGFSIEQGGRFLLYNSGNTLRIGKNCMFSNNVTVRCGESPHLVFEEKSGEYIDISDGVLIGDHVWVGESVYLTKSAAVGSECIVGACSVVTKKFEVTNAVLAGNPAKVAKENVQWIRNRSYLEPGSKYMESYTKHVSMFPKIPS